MRPHLGGGITAASIRGGICDLFNVGRGRERDAREAGEAKTWRGGKEEGGADRRTATSSYIIVIELIFCQIDYGSKSNVMI